ncbi:MAG TPA: TldD/PmbA family protein, partial [Methanomassiliicoccales archaeon]|nr:TldD/PmbA family protein [Methanomassiliicoccales archaeon]
MQDILQKAVERMLEGEAQFCDSRFQSLRKLNVAMVDGAVRTLTEDRIEGVCLRARCGGSWGYASTISMEQGEVMAAASIAAKNAWLGTARGKPIPDMKGERGTHKSAVKLHPAKVPLEEKLSLVKDLDRAQRDVKGVVNSNASYVESVKTNMLANSFGTSLKWEEIRGRLNCMSIASDGSRTEVYYDIVDGSGGFELFKSLDTSKMGHSCAKEAERMLSAKKCPSGETTCITDPMISGLLAHEVMGHASEADEIVKKRSFLTEVVGKRVASDLITMVDDGTIRSAHGYI